MLEFLKIPDLEEGSAFSLQNASWYTYTKYYMFTLFICFLIACMFWLIGTAPFYTHLITSVCIGTFTHACTVLGITHLGHRVPLLGIILVSVPVGSLAGLTIASLLSGRSLENVTDAALSTIFIAFLASSVFISFYSSFMIREALRQEEIKSLRNENRLVETQLQLLQSQIEPHFLFNTLSHVISLMGTDVEKSEVMLRKLTQFLRVSLKRSRSLHGSLGDELRLVSDYLDILQIRMGDRLAYDIHVDVDPESIDLPPLILQPIVENAVIHGLEPKETGGRIDITVKVEDELKIIVADTGVGMTGIGSVGGMGISNVQQRLEMLFSDRASLQVSDTTPEGLTVSITLPRNQRS